MKILYCLTKSESGGVQTHIFQLSRYMKENGHEPIIMARPGGWLEEESRRLGVSFYPNPYISNNIFDIPRLFKAAKAIKKLIEETNPDIVSLHSSTTGFIGRLVVRKRIPTIFTAHGWGFTPGIPFWRRWLAVVAERMVAPWTSSIVCVSEYDHQLALKYKVGEPKQLTTIHNGVEVDIKASFPRDKFRNNKTEIIFIGRLNKQKDPLLLLQAFSDLPDVLKNKSTLTLIGGGNKMEELRKFVKQEKLNQVSLLGPRPRVEVLKLLENGHIFTLTSNWEGFPRTTLEAMSKGLVPIVSDVGGARESLDEKSGVVVPKGNKKAVKDALESLIENREKLESMAKMAYDRVRGKFSLDRMLKETLRLYKSILDNSY